MKLMNATVRKYDYRKQNSLLYARLRAQPRSGDPNTNFPIVIAVVAS